MCPGRVRMPKFRSRKTSASTSSETSSEVHLETAHERAEARINGCLSKADKALLDQWRAAEDWTDLLDLNRAYLKGEEEFTPYYMGPIHDETRTLVPGLLSLHDHELFTVQSQPSSDTGQVESKCTCGNDPPWYEMQQRAFITFLIPKGESDCEIIDASVIDGFLDELMADDKLYTSIIAFDGVCEMGGCKKNLEIRSNFPDRWASHKQKTATSKKILKAAEEQYRQIFETDCACQLKNFKSQLELMAHMNPYMVHVLAKSWDEPDLPELVKLRRTELVWKHCTLEMGMTFQNLSR